MSAGTAERVDANGVPAEWVEAAIAKIGQPTILYFEDFGSLEGARSQAIELAFDTGARVLSVDCAAVTEGVSAFAWLLGEGLDLDTTTFLDARPGSGMAAAVRRAAQAAGLPLPCVGQAAVTAQSFDVFLGGLSLLKGPDEVGG